MILFLDKFDPCKLGTDNCSSHANCIRYGEMVNGVYKYNCTCIEGYKGSGIGENGCVGMWSNLITSFVLPAHSVF